MADLPESAIGSKSELNSKKELGSACTPSANIKAHLDLQAREGSQRASCEATSNPFATPGKKSKEDPAPSEPPAKPTGG
jgi:hypothetical protein